MDRLDDNAFENRRSSNQLLVDKSGRKPLFASANSRDGGARDDASQHPRPVGGRRYQPPIDGLTNRSRHEPPTPSSAARGTTQARPLSSGSRVAQAKGSSISHRKPLSMSEAYRLAEQEEDGSGGEDDGPMAGSPSPAPRTWRSRFNSQMKATEAGRELAKVTRGEQGVAVAGGENPSRSPNGRYDYAEGEDVALPPLGPGIDDSPLPSPGPKEGLASPMKRHSANTSPQKSFAWDIDQDFTAGDLQVSDSPRIRVDDRPFANRRAFEDNSEIDLNSPMRLNPPGSRNTKLDEIRVLERRAGDAHTLDATSPRRNTKLDEIAAREASAESQIPIPERKLSTPRNNKLAEIRQRELEGLSKRQLASLRLGEIREQNSMARSRFDDFEPQIAKESSEERVPESKTEADMPARPKSAYEAAREARTNTNTAFQSRQKGGRELSRSLEDNNWRTSSEPVRPAMSHNRKSSTDVLRTAKPVSGTAAQRRTLSNTTSEKTSDSSDTKSRFAKRAARNGRKQTKDGNGDNKRLTVGFAGLKRVQSTESTNSKRSSMHSEPDPTERLEAELKLFAPTDNYSEPGSVRAQSPVSESDEEKMAEATPKPKRQDPLLMPTPKVTGAYVETPATVRVEKIAPEETKSESIPAEAGEQRPTRASLGDRKRSSSWSSAERHTSSEPGAGERQPADEDLATTKKPRSRSLPRRRLPIRNTAKLPSVKDDLLELHRLHNVEDSTLDNLEEILTGQKPAPPSVAEEFKKQDKIDAEDEDLALEVPTNLEKQSPEPPKRSAVLQKAVKEESPDADDLATYDRMSKSLQTVSLSIHDAKKGIEKLEDRFTSSQAEKAHTMAVETHVHDEHHCPACTARPDASAMAYIQVPFPRLFHRTPTFRFTFLGLILFVTSLWYATETAMCANFCRPYYCDPSSGPCVWSFDDPTSFGTALPIKVDQWVTGGYGRKRFEAIYEILDDAKEDLVDAALGRQITDVDINSLPTPEKRRQHRRRLRNKGLVKRKSVQDASPEDREKWAAWRRARRAAERASEAREMGYAWEDEDGSVGGDVPIA